MASPFSITTRLGLTTISFNLNVIDDELHKQDVPVPDESNNIIIVLFFYYFPFPLPQIVNITPSEKKKWSLFFEVFDDDPTTADDNDDAICDTDRVFVSLWQDFLGSTESARVQWSRIHFPLGEWMARDERTKERKKERKMPYGLGATFFHYHWHQLRRKTVTVAPSAKTRDAPDLVFSVQFSVLRLHSVQPPPTSALPYTYKVRRRWQRRKPSSPAVN